MLLVRSFGIFEHGHGITALKHSSIILFSVVQSIVKAIVLAFFNVSASSCTQAETSPKTGEKIIYFRVVIV
jgi:hypothetical protein